MRGMNPPAPLSVEDESGDAIMSSSASYVSDIFDDEGTALSYRRLLVDIRDSLGIDMRLLSKLLGIPTVQLAIVLSDETCRFANRRYERNVEIAWNVINGRYDGDTSRGLGLVDDIKQAIVAEDSRNDINGPVLSAWEMIELDGGNDEEVEDE